MASERSVVLAATAAATAAVLWCLFAREPDLRPRTLAVVSPTCRACDAALRDLRERGALSRFTVVGVDALDAATLDALVRAGYTGKLPFFYDRRTARAHRGYTSYDALVRSAVVGT